jgi:hypothetical protein
VDVPDYFIRVDFASRGAMKIGNGRIRNRKAFKFLLSDRMGNGPHVALNFLLRDRSQCRGASP